MNKPWQDKLRRIDPYPSRMMISIFALDCRTLS